MPSIIEQYHMDIGSASLLMAAFTIVPIILALPAGALVQKTGVRNLYLIGTACLLAGSLLGAFVNDPTVLIISRGIEGTAFIFGMIAGPVAIQTFVAPEERGAATGLWGTNIAVGIFLGGALTPGLFNAVGITGVWLVYAAFCVLAAVIVFAFIKGKPAENALAISNSGRGDAGGQPEADIMALFKPAIFLFLLAFGLFNLVSIAPGTFAPTFMQGQGMDATRAGTLSTLPNLLSIIMCPLFGVLADKTGKTKLLLLVACVCVAPGALILLTTTNTSMWLGIVLLAIAGATPTMALIIFPQLLKNPALVGIGMGVFNIFTFAGQLVGTTLPAAVLDAFNNSWIAVGSLLCALGLLAALLFLVVRMRKPLPAE